MSVPVINVLIENYAEDSDQAWSWMRSMHELGYSLVASLQFDISFHQGSEIIVPLAKGGALVWVVLHHGQVRDNAFRQLAANMLTGLSDPVTAARWWVTEKSNQPQFPSPAPIAQPQWNQAGVAMPLPPIQQPMQVPGQQPMRNNGQPVTPAFPPPVAAPPVQAQPTYSDAFIDAVMGIPPSRKKP